MMQVIQVIFFIICITIQRVTSVIKASNVPILLNLKRVVPNSAQNRSNSESGKPVQFKHPRSRPLLFQQVLGLTAGSDFDFNVDKWRALQSCGLYHNLTARTVIKEDGIALLIEGLEGPSLKFAPEISVGGSVSDPEMSGGLVFSDRNFRGLGDNLEILLLKKEGIEESLSNLGANWRISWKDCPIGKNFRTTFEVEHENSLDLVPNFLPPPTITDDDESGTNTDGVRDKSRKLEEFFHWKGAISQNRVRLSTTKEVVRTAESVLTWTFEPFFHTIKIPSISDLRQPIRSSGARVKLTQHTSADNVMRYNVWYETGRTSFPLPSMQSDWQTYHHTGIDLTFPTIRTEMQQPFWRKLPFLSGLDGDKPLSLLHRFRLNTFKTWGRGSLPSYHGKSLPNSQIVRGFPANLARLHNSVQTLVNLKWDMYVENFPFGKFGFFSDAAIYREVGNAVKRGGEGRGNENNKNFWNTVKTASSVGSSFSYKGFRVDVGVPINSWRTPRLYLGVDIEQ